MTTLQRDHQYFTRRRDREHGSVLALFVFAIFFLLMCLALAVDLGAAYFASSTLTKAADAGALAAARYGMGDSVDAEDLAESVAAANFPLANIDAEYEATVSYPGIDTIRVTVQASSEVPTFFGKVLQRDSLPIHTTSEATRYPLDMSLVLDISGSLEDEGVFDDMQEAAQAFVGFFNEDLDQIGLVSYSQHAREHLSIQKYFMDAINSEIDELEAIAYTNIEEALRVGREQLDAAPERDASVRILVLFTDGRTNAFADEFYVDQDSPAPEYYDGIISTTNSGASGFRGFYEQDTGNVITGFNSATGDTITCDPDCSSAAFEPVELPGGASVTGSKILELAVEQAEEQAEMIRLSGYTIYTVALGNVAAADVYDTPDLDFLTRLANEDGIVDSTQNEGAMLYTENASDLEDVFAQLADRILTRLTK
jgi:Flp pilus assembly protein TadG